MTLDESIELREIKKRLCKNHATRADVARAREILASDAGALERFNLLVEEKAAMAKLYDRTAADRQQRHREKASAFLMSLTPVDPARRAACEFDLVAFGLTYCRQFLKHPPSERMINTLIRPLQNVILHGGQQVLEFPRGIGKTVWVKIAMIWAAVYGHKHFIVCIAATRGLAEDILSQVVGAFERSVELAEDFPALAVPIMKLSSNWRRASTQKWEGRPTRVEYSGGYFVLPTIYKTGSDELAEVGCGARFYTAGIHGAIRGLGDDSNRPDMIFIDDPQTREEAESPDQCEKIERLIVNDALGGFGNTETVAAIMAVTPIRMGDVATRFASRRKHPEWGLSKQPYVLEMSPGFKEAYPGFRQAYNEDVAISDALTAKGEIVSAEQKWQLSNQYYQEHRADFEGTVVLDPLNFAPGEDDAIHHLLKLMSRFHDLADFEAEYNMNVEGELDGSILQPDEVSEKVNGLPRNVLPPGMFDVVGSIDVNIAKQAGLRYVLMAVGPNRTTAIVNRGMFPKDGSALVPPNTDPVERADLIKRGIKSVIREILRQPLRTTDGERVIPAAVAIDAGYEPDAVHAAVKEIVHGCDSHGRVNLHGMELMCSLGRAWSQFRNLKKGEDKEVIVKDHLYSGVTIKRVKGHAVTRKYLGMHSDYWREIMQKSFRRPVFSPGSCSIYGDDPGEHYDFALEITYEQLVRTYREQKKPYRQAWEWINENPGHNHWGDCCYGCFALACWKDLYKAEAPLPPSVTAPRVKPSAKVEWIDDEKDRERIAAAKRARFAAAARRTLGKAKSKRGKLFRTIRRPRY